jgi:hypothetical protein
LPCILQLCHIHLPICLFPSPVSVSQNLLPLFLLLKAISSLINLSFSHRISLSLLLEVYSLSLFLPLHIFRFCLFMDSSLVVRGRCWFFYAFSQCFFSFSFAVIGLEKSHCSFWIRKKRRGSLFFFEADKKGMTLLMFSLFWFVLYFFVAFIEIVYVVGSGFRSLLLLYFGFYWFSLSLFLLVYHGTRGKSENPSGIYSGCF